MGSGRVTLVLTYIAVATGGARNGTPEDVKNVPTAPMAIEASGDNVPNSITCACRDDAGRKGGVLVQYTGDRQRIWWYSVEEVGGTWGRREGVELPSRTWIRRVYCREVSRGGWGLAVEVGAGYGTGLGWHSLVLLQVSRDRFVELWWEVIGATVDGFPGWTLEGEWRLDVGVSNGQLRVDYAVSVQRSEASADESEEWSDVISCSPPPVRCSRGEERTERASWLWKRLDAARERQERSEQVGVDFLGHEESMKGVLRARPQDRERSSPE